MSETKFKYIVYLGSDGCEAIINVTTFEDAYIEHQLLSDDQEKSPYLEAMIHKINNMELRVRFNSQRRIEAYVWSTEYTKDELWDMLEKNGDYHNLVKTTAKPYENTQGNL